MKRTMLYAAVLAAVCGSGFGAEKAGPGVGLTIYNDNFAVVREARVMAFEKGVNTLKFTDVASAIDPTSVNFECLSSPGAISILEQNYEYDLVNTDSLLKRYIDRDVTLMLRGSGADAGKEASGTLMAAMGGDLIIKGEDGQLHVVSKASVEEVSLKEMPDDLVTRPTLVWLARADKEGEQLCQVAYTTGSIGWKADYLAVLNTDDTALDFSGWVTINNSSGASYKEASLKLIAGDVRRITPPAPQAPRERMVMALAMEKEGFEEKPFMEYHMYTLGRRSTINNNQVKQIEFIEPASGVAARKIFVYERGSRWYYGAAQEKGKVNVKIEFENKKENKLGIALPKGKVRVFKKDPADNSLQFVGEDQIDHTPKDEKLSLYIGDAFDIVAEYTMTDSKVATRMRQETHKVELRNRKDEAVTVFVDEIMPAWVNWKISQETHKYTKKNSQTARFEVSVEAGATVEVRYTVTQTW